MIKKKTKIIQQPPGKLFSGYDSFLNELKERIHNAQIRASLSANKELIILYWNIGRRLSEEQGKQGWGAALIPRLANDLHNELSQIKGFSERNLKYMMAFYREYPVLEIVQQVAAQLAKNKPVSTGNRKIVENKADPTKTAIASLVLSLPWRHNILLMEKIQNPDARLWYMQSTIELGWSRNMLFFHIKNESFHCKGKAITNFKKTLPPIQSDMAVEVLKDPYIFDFLTIDKPFRERELETGLLTHIEKFLLELGSGFAFIGRQVRLEIGEKDFYIDLLFYHLHLRCYFIIDLKTDSFKAEYAGKMNFYLNAVDDRLRHPSDNLSIGLILCQEKDRIVAEYALRGMEKAIGISEYQLTRSLPHELKSSLPSIEELEKELQREKE